MTNAVHQANNQLVEIVKKAISLLERNREKFSSADSIHEYLSISLFMAKRNTFSIKGLELHNRNYYPVGLNGKDSLEYRIAIAVCAAKISLEHVMSLFEKGSSEIEETRMCYSSLLSALALSELK